MPELISIPEAAKRIPMAEATLTSWIRKDKLATDGTTVAANGRRVRAFYTHRVEEIRGIIATEKEAREASKRATAERNRIAKERADQAKRIAREAKRQRTADYEDSATAIGCTVIVNRAWREKTLGPFSTWIDSTTLPYPNAPATVPVVEEQAIGAAA